jgi:hypothetical protein
VDRAIGIALLLLFAALVLPALAAMVQALVPALVAVLVLLIGLRLVLPPRH